MKDIIKPNNNPITILITPSFSSSHSNNKIETTEKSSELYASSLSKFLMVLNKRILIASFTTDSPNKIALSFG